MIGHFNFKHFMFFVFDNTAHELTRNMIIWMHKIIRKLSYQFCIIAEEFLPFLFIHIFIILGILSNSAYAHPQCLYCQEEIQNEGTTLLCPQNHIVHGNCLWKRIEVLPTVSIIQTDGLQCDNLNEQGAKCRHTFTLEQIRDTLDNRQMHALTERMGRENSHDPQTFNKDVRSLSKDICESFVFCCLNEGCGEHLDGTIEGCSVASCPNTKCASLFCYLCLEKQDNIQVAHRHVIKHSGSPWERRPGYCERYHWVLARKELAQRLKRKIHPTIRKTALDHSKNLLEEKRMWPCPAGKMTADWLKEVELCELIHEQKIELLQNEGVYQHQVKNQESSDLIDAAIYALNGTVLASLDVQGAVNEKSHGIISQAELVAPMAHFRIEAPRIIPILDNAPVTRASQPPAHSPAYRIENLFWSRSLEKMTQQEAEQFCLSLGGGARLPTIHEWETLKQAMTGIDGYNKNMIDGINDKWFWSSSILADRPDSAFYFDGYHGTTLGFTDRSIKKSVRCVWPT